MNILQGEAMFPHSRWPLPCGAGAALMVLADTRVSEAGAGGGLERQVRSHFLFGAAKG